MFDNVKWEEIINNVLCFIDKWEYLVVKTVISKYSYSTNYFYSENGEDYTNIYSVIDNEQISTLSDNVMPELKKITEKFKDHNEKMFITMKVEKAGNVKIIYRDIKEGNKLPFDEGTNYLRLNEDDKKN